MLYTILLDDITNVINVTNEVSQSFLPAVGEDYVIISESGKAMLYNITQIRRIYDSKTDTLTIVILSHPGKPYNCPEGYRWGTKKEFNPLVGRSK